ncbi:acyl-CoA carboxylase epsilon subunit [Streptomyces sp. NPDC059248]|uniref:acyl-CoA carboxylase epsilon subunit n=1 Tax=Streptomyces sp. NPDC059248 TaxID=3346791 RepID=UPI0036C8917C
MTRRAEPWIRVLYGEPSAEELVAAVIALRLVADDRARRTGAARGTPARRRGGPADWQRRCPERRGPGAWRGSGWY